MNNQGSSGSGVVFNSGGTLHVESCVVNGFSSAYGLFFNGPGRIEVKDSIMRNDFRSIHVVTASGTALGIVEHVEMEGGYIGLQVRDNCNVTVRNSLASGMSGVGMAANSFGTPAELNIENCILSNNFDGVQSAIFVAGGTATLRISNSTVTGNSNFGLKVSSNNAVILSRGNNTVEGNGINASGGIGSYNAK